MDTNTSHPQRPSSGGVSPRPASSKASGGLVPRAAAENRGGHQVIPVGQEPRRQEHEEAGANTLEVRVGRSVENANDKNSNMRVSDVRNPERFHAYRNALQELTVFRQESMRHLRRSEIVVWLAIHGCQGRKAARISYGRLVELTGTSRVHVGKAIKSLQNRGLLEVLVKGRFRPNQNGEHGLASLYRVYPRAEPRLVMKPGPGRHVDVAFDNT